MNAGIGLEEGSDFEHLEYPPPNYFVSSALPKDYESDPSLLRNSPMTLQEFSQFMDADGRLTDEHTFRRAVFKGGIESSIRKDVWKFLFGYYFYRATRIERKSYDSESVAKYHALKRRWKEDLYQHLQDEIDPSKNTLRKILEKYSNAVNANVDASHPKNFFDVQAKVHAGRQPLDITLLPESIYAIDKDVPRTDRTHPYFADDDSPHFHMLWNVLVTFAAYHPTIGYAQGMNDIAGRFLIVFDSEPEAYWCFTNLIEKVPIDFLEEGMHKKLELLGQLLKRADPDLYFYLSDCGVQDLAFCHRWVFLFFLREFDFETGLKMFEILSSHYLEINSLPAENVRELSRQNNLEQEGGSECDMSCSYDSELTFPLFVCIAILIENRVGLFNCKDNIEAFQCIYSMPSKMTLDQILSKAEMLFYAYCKRTVVAAFEAIEIPKEQSNSNWF